MNVATPISTSRLFSEASVDEASTHQRGFWSLVEYGRTGSSQVPKSMPYPWCCCCGRGIPLCDTAGVRTLDAQTCWQLLHGALKSQMVVVRTFIQLWQLATALSLQLLIRRALSQAYHYHLEPGAVVSTTQQQQPLFFTSNDPYLAEKTNNYTRTSDLGWGQACQKFRPVAWAAKYALWHAQERLRPGAKFLLYVCGNPPWAGTQRASFSGLCGGFGDRVKGMMEMVRLAAYAERVVLFDWADPLPLEEVFQSADIDWRVHASYQLSISSSPYIQWDFSQPQPPELADGSWKDMYSDERIVIMQLKQQDTAGKLFPYWPSLQGRYSTERRCLFNMLFKPSAGVQQQVTEQRKQLFGNLEQSYVAVHLSLGGTQGESNKVVPFNHLKGLLASLVCARNLANAHNMTHAPILLITDNPLLRRMVAADYFKGVIGPNLDLGVPTHLDSARTAATSSHMAAFTDIGLLSKASCLLSSYSGFSFAAWYWGYPACHNSVENCLAVVEAP